MPKALESPVGLVTLAPGAEVDATITDDRSGLSIGLVYALAMPIADTEYTLALPAEVRAFTAKLLIPGKLSIRFQAAGDYATRSPGSVYISGKTSPDAPALTLYVKSSQTSDTLEVETWT